MNVKRLQAKYGGIDYRAYEPYRQLKRKIITTKKILIKDIMQVVTPHMWETGYCKNNFAFDEKPRIMLKAFFFEFSEKKKENGTDQYKIGNLQIIGFSEHGLCTDAYGGGLAYQEMMSIPIEDLLKLHVWILNRKEFKNKT